MLHDRDRQRLEQIEQELRAEDPDFAARLNDPRGSAVARWLTPARLVGAVMLIAALLSFALGEGLAFSAAVFVSACAFLLDGWTIRSD
jgi:hypothetical protein